MLTIIVIIILSYLAGSIPTSIIFSKLLRGIDIRDHGSGNAGGTNAIRVLGWKIGGTVMIIDIGKGVLATLVISQIRIDPISLNPDLIQIIAGLSAILGQRRKRSWHCCWYVVFTLSSGWINLSRHFWYCFVGNQNRIDKFDVCCYFIAHCCFGFKKLAGLF